VGCGPVGTDSGVVVHLMAAQVFSLDVQPLEQGPRVALSSCGGQG